MPGMRRFFVPGTSTIGAADYAYRQSLLREGVAALPYAECVIGPKSGCAIQILRVCLFIVMRMCNAGRHGSLPLQELLLKILRVGADRRVRPHGWLLSIPWIDSGNSLVLHCYPKRSGCFDQTTFFDCVHVIVHAWFWTIQAEM